MWRNAGRQDGRTSQVAIARLGRTQDGKGVGDATEGAALGAAQERFGARLGRDQDLSSAPPAWLDRVGLDPPIRCIGNRRGRSGMRGRGRPESERRIAGLPGSIGWVLTHRSGASGIAAGDRECAEGVDPKANGGSQVMVGQDPPYGLRGFMRCRLTHRSPQGHRVGLDPPKPQSSHGLGLDPPESPKPVPDFGFLALWSTLLSNAGAKPALRCVPCCAACSPCC